MKNSNNNITLDNLHDVWYKFKKRKYGDSLNWHQIYLKFNTIYRPRFGEYINVNSYIKLETMPIPGFDEYSEHATVTKFNTFKDFGDLVDYVKGEGWRII